MDIEKEMSDRAERIEKIIRSYLPEEDEQNYYDNTVRLAMNYSVLAGGKRLRPMLMVPFSKRHKRMFRTSTWSSIRRTNA